MIELRLAEKERPILFSAPMVRALLAGTKTQTRRVVKVPKRMEGVTSPAGALVDFDCPYGRPGDRLWVRETFSYDAKLHFRGDRGPCWYWADGNPEYGDWTKPRPSIHMPRWASRITLEITGVRVERLQSISEEDALAEGATLHKDKDPDYGYAGWYRALWESINGPDSWAANPFVWVIEFSLSREGK